MLTAILIGAGMRGYGYAQYQKVCNDFKVIAVAEKAEFQRQRLKQLCGIPDEMVFTDWKDVAEKERFAECVIICTPDKLHKDSTVAFAKRGYNILLEKPMATTEEDCCEIVQTCKDNNVSLTVCLVLRYTSWAMKIEELIENGAIGDVVNIQLLVGYWHFAHSHVRGNWRKESHSSFSLLSKCSHDTDLICHWMGNRKCHSVSSFGHLSHFNQENKPPNAASRCLDCPREVESKCPYSAVEIYINNGIKSMNRDWPVSVVVSGIPDLENVTEALKTGPYGRCVYDMDNDVMTQQVVNMQFDGGATASLTMVGFTQSVCGREVNIFGTKGEIRYREGWNEVEQVNFVDGQRYRHQLPAEKSGVLSGYGEEDFFLMKSFVENMSRKDFSKIKTGAEETLASHMVAFAAEKARKENRVVIINKDLTFT